MTILEDIKNALSTWVEWQRLMAKASILNVESMVFPIFANCDSSLIREDFPCQQHYHQRFERVSNNTSKRA